MDVFAFGTGRKRRPKTSSIARSSFPPARGGGFATVKAVVEHKGVADSGLGFRVQLAADQPIASADNGALKSAIWRMADKNYQSHAITTGSAIFSGDAEIR